MSPAYNEHFDAQKSDRRVLIVTKLFNIRVIPL